MSWTISSIFASPRSPSALRARLAAGPPTWLRPQPTNSTMRIRMPRAATIARAASARRARSASSRQAQALLIAFGLSSIQGLRGIVKNDPERHPVAAVHPAHAMAQNGAPGAARPCHRALAHRENDAFAARQRHRLGARLHARPLLGHDEGAAAEVALGLAQQNRRLQ